MFLIPEDYKPYIRKEIKDDILLNDTSLIANVEMAAQQEISSYLAGRYDLDKVFVPIKTWTAEAVINLDDYVYDINASNVGKIYRSVLNQTAVKPSEEILEADPTYVLEDPRNPIIVLRMVYITLYHAHKSLPGSSIPKLRIDDYDISIRWLENVAKGMLNPLLPVVENVTGLASWGGEDRRQNRY